MNSTIELLSKRRSVAAAHLAAPGPDAAQLDQLLTLASRVPDHGKLAPWRFIVFQGEAREAIGEKLAALVAKRGEEATPARLEEEKRRFVRAPLVVCVVSRAAEHVKIPVWEQRLSAGAVCFALEVAAHAMGYAAIWLTGWISYDAEARALVGLKPGERVAGFIHIGTATTLPQDRPRPALADIVTYWDET